MVFKMNFAVLPVAIAAILSHVAPVASQSFTKCDPLKKSCPANPALGKSTAYDLTQGLGKDWTANSDITHGSDGAEFTVSKQGDNPEIQSDFYIMFGRVDITMKAAPGTGIASSAVIQSDCRDEIDWEWIGGDSTHVQTNYFAKGQAGGYNRAATHEDKDSQDKFKTYTIDWNSKRIIWMIDGTEVRTLNAADAQGMYPQTPSFVKVGIWAGGDPNNEKGTIEWAGGKTDYSAGPYVMHVKSIHVEDYSTGSEYEYSDKSCTWKSIKAGGGKVNGDSSGTDTASAPSATSPSKMDSGEQETSDEPKTPTNGTEPTTSIFGTGSGSVPTASETGAPPPFEGAANGKVQVEAVMGVFFVLASTFTYLL